MFETELVEQCRDLVFCPDCLGLTGRVLGPFDDPAVCLTQGCRCHTTQRVELAALCRCCGSELLPSGDLLTIWFCAGCEFWVDRLNEFLGAATIPIGVAPQTAAQRRRQRDAIERLDRRDLTILSWNLRELRLDARGRLTLADYLAAIETRRIDRVARFAHLCETFGLPREAGEALAWSDLVSA